MRDKLWMEKFKGANLKDHHRRLRESTHLVDDASPPKAQRSTRLARERERKLQLIDKHNHIFLNRLASTVQKKNIDNDPFKKKAMTSDMSKRRLHKKLQRENNHILNRIQNAEKTYSAAQWRKEEAWRQTVLKNMMDPTLNHDHLGGQSSNQLGHSPVKRPSSARRPNSAQRNISPQRTRKKAAWAGTAIALNEQDRMHLSPEIKSLPASPVFLKRAGGGSGSGSPGRSPSVPALRKRPATAGGNSRPRTRSQSRLPPSPNSITSETPSVTRQREMKKLFRPTGAYMSTKV